MDVTCARCGTEYEFDETLVSDRGTTVKCTSCGHLFKVFRPDAAASGGRGGWLVEQTDGTRRTLRSLKELQRLITQGVLSPDDWISRSGEPPKRLGDIAELTSFFEATATVVANVPAPSTRSTPIPGRGAPAAPAERPHARTLDGAAIPPADETIPERRPKQTIMGVGGIASEPSSRRSQPPSDTLPDVARTRSEPPRAAPPPRPASTPPPPPPRPLRADPEATAPARPAARKDALGSEPTPSRAAASGAAPTRGRGLYLDADEPAAPPRARSRSGLWVALVVLLAAGVGVALAWPQLAPTLGLSQPVDPALPYLEQGDAALAHDDLAGYEDALIRYTQALAYDDRAHQVLTRLSRAQALWAQALLFDASDLEARAEEDPVRRGEAAAIRREVQRRAEAALHRAEDAVRQSSGDADAEIALADALRLTGDLPRARSRLDRALRLRSEPSAEALRVQALIEAAENGGDLAAARARAEEAVEKDPTLIRARLLAARALLASREVGAARRHVDAVLQTNAQHAAARALRSAIDEGLPPAPPAIDVPKNDAPGDASSSEENVEPEPEPEPTAAPTGEARASSGRRGRQETSVGDEGESGAIPAGRDYSWYVRNGDEQRRRGDLGRARAYYEAARNVRPSGSEALTGLGHAELQGGNAQTAASLFRQAAGQGYAEAYIGLGDAYRRLGRTQDARTAYERYLERLPGGPHAAIAQRHIDELRRQQAPVEDETPAPRTAETAPSEPARTETTDQAGSTEPPEPAPSTPSGALPPPRNMEGPPPEDVPAIDSDPEYQP